MTTVKKLPIVVPRIKRKSSSIHVAYHFPENSEYSVDQIIGNSDPGLSDISEITGSPSFSEFSELPRYLHAGFFKLELRINLLVLFKKFFKFFRFIIIF